jgi:aminoglycoside 3-N-acetyltransferase
MQADYTLDDLKQALLLCAVSPGDVGRLGWLAGLAPAGESWANDVIDAVLEVIGPHGTLVVPTYTYSLGKGETFDVDNTPAAIGDFPEAFRQRAGVIRSRDPMLSHAAIGPEAEAIVRTISRSCCGEGSVFHRLREHDAKICTLGVSLYYATFLHHIEESAAVPFRFAKPFRGRVREAGREATETWTYFAAPRGLPNCAKNPLPMEKIVRNAGLAHTAPVGRGDVMTIRARDYFDEGIRQFRMNPWLTAAGPPIPIDRYVAAELAGNPRSPE